jgi:hypothetical protein
LLAFTPSETFATGFPAGLALNVDLSTLPPGLHQLAFQVQDGRGRWSETNWLAVQVQDAATLIPNPANLPITDANNLLTYAEYFWDFAPALSNGVPVNVAAAETFTAGYPNALPLNVDLSSLTTGLHHLGFRMVDARGRWSETNWLAVQVQDATTLLPNPVSFPITDAVNHLVFAEYFWDADPGLSNGVPLSCPAAQTFAPGGNLLPALNIPVPHLPLGVHYLSLRTRDASGRWATNQAGLVLDRKTDFILATAITVLTNAGTSIFTITNFSCPGPGQLCSNLYDLYVTTESLLAVQYTAATANCADVRMHFWVDGTERAVSARLGAGAASGWFALGPVTNGTHLLQLQAEGFLGGCDVGLIFPHSHRVFE